MKIFFRAIAGLFAALALSAGAAEISAESYVQPAVPSAKGALAKSERARATRVKEIILPLQTVESLPKAMREAQKPGTPLQIGHGRPVPEVATDAIDALEWEQSASGESVGALSITSPGAAALRAGLRIYSLPAGTTVRFYGRNDDALYEVSGREILSLIATNLAAGDTSEFAHIFWSPVVDDSTVVIEFELPAGARASDLRVGVPHVSHLITSAKMGFAVPKFTTASTACNLDATCSIGTWGSQMNAVARMLFNDGTGSFLCTGTLLATSPASTIPYFLTANHCISTATSAGNLQTYWFYRSTGCNNATLGPYQTRTGGAALLYHSPVTGITSIDNATYSDTSFLQLNSAPPAGAVFAGWATGTPPAIGAAITGIHHPGGDLLKIAFGNIDSYWNCSPPTSGSFGCGGSTSTASNFYGNTWSSGLTEPGSSGSGIFRSDGKLIGQLYGGTSHCPAMSGDGDIYGRFDVAFNASGGLGGYLFSAVQYALTVSKAGTGSGSVSSVPSRINCGATCSANFSDGTVVTLTASPAIGSVLSSWSGCTALTNPLTCNITMSAASGVTATFTAVPPVALTIARSGAGSGNVTSAPAGIDCGATCSATFAVGTSVTLTAAPTGMSSFTVWSGACSGTGNTCTLTMDAAKSATASFGPPPQVDVTKAGTGSGTVTSNPAGINCGTTCSAPFGQNSNVTLTAVAAPGSAFGGYSGACVGLRGCSLVMSASRAVTATFNSTSPPPQTLTVSKTGTGGGTVTSMPAGISCGATCSASYTAGTSVTLSAVAAGGSTFTSWGGACSGTGSCVVAMNAATSVSANFDTAAGAPTLTVVRAGTGTGTVTSTPAGISCGTACGSTFTLNSSVTLMASPAAGATFGGWSGACTGMRACMVSMTASKSVTATFNGGTPPPPPTQQTLTVSLAGTGTGSVASSPAGISCGATCSANFTTGTAVTLTPTANSGSTFGSWSGACSGSGACMVTMNAAASVTATFFSVTPPPPGGNTLTIVKAGAGAALGLVTSVPAGINCGTTCAADFAVGASVSLRATPGAGRTFAGWSGGCVSTRAACTLPVNAATTVTATFN